MDYSNRCNSAQNKTNLNCVVPGTPHLCLLVLALIVFLSSCASPVGKYSPDPIMITTPEANDSDDDSEEFEPVKSKTVIKVNISNPVKISNAQPSTREQPLDFRGIIVNYKEFTQSMVEALTLEYKKNNVTVNDSSEKELHVKVTEIDMYMAGFTYRANISVEIKYGNGSTESFEATRGSYGSPLMINHFPTKPLDAAFKDIVTKIIHNKKIQDYINR